MDHDAYLKFMVNLAAFIHTRPPIYKPHYSYSLMLKNMFDMLDMARKKRGDEQPNFSRKKDKETV